ncbi:glycerol kinase GlpK [Leucothrix arctica]|uniref:Glycerol kinase n=1 Tax=Leucothrix arctica TaxID=1481894 RepID=A0A317CD03_9GAMM|nr:glycerol kinase GlpK [Leucothrix arctica]PWQ96269.1 glycerol kinase [Leucothrix arctica]
MSHFIAAIDQGTTSTRCIIFDKDLKAIASAQEEFTQHFPNSGWVEHDPSDLVNTVKSTFAQAIKEAGLMPSDIASIGITNQRETLVLWDRITGEPLYNAIVWQDRRTADFCQSLKDQGLEAMITEKTGLRADPYFSGTKLHWLLKNVDGAKERAANGELYTGTVDTWLIWKLTGGKHHVTDASNASRTMLYNIHEGQWDDEILTTFEIPKSLLPKVKDSSADFGHCAESELGAAIHIGGVAGDQHAAMVGQACFEPGMMKSTYGTGCFAMVNTGDKAVTSKNNLLTTIAYQLDGKTVYALEGSIFIAGAAVQWLRDGIGVIEEASETEAMAKAADPKEDVYLVPAFVGLGAPYWNPNVRGAMFGITRNTGPNEFSRAALESVAYQTLDLIDAMRADSGELQDTELVLRVDGGMTASNWTMQFLADMLDCEVDRPTVLETTALGVAYLAGYQSGLYPEPAQFAKEWALDRSFKSLIDEQLRAKKYDGWKRAVESTISYG